MKISQRQIAAQLGVSQTAISMVLNNPGTAKVSGTKRKAILDYLRKTNYIMRHHGGKTWNIGYLLDDSLDISNPFYNRFFNGIVEQAGKSEYSVIVGKLCRPGNGILPVNKVDGLIIETANEKSEITRIPADIPVVMLNSCDFDGRFDAVVPDNTGGMFRAVRHLYEYGHRRIGYFCAGSSGEYRYRVHHAERLDAFRNAMESLQGYPVDNKYISIVTLPEQGALTTEAAVSSTLSEWMNLPEPPSAIICSNDYYGLIFIRLATASGLKIPEQLSVIGTDNTQECEYSMPQLTSVDHNGTAMGRMAVDMLIKRIHDPDPAAMRISCGSRLIVRASTAVCSPSEKESDK